MTPRLAPFALAALVAVGSAQQVIPPPPPTPPTTTPPRTTPVRPQSPTTTVPGPADYRVGIISGQIVDATTGRALTQVAVRLRGRGVARTTLSDSGGRFSFADVPPGDFMIRASKSGFFDGAYGKRRAGGDGMAFTLIPAVSAPNLTIELFKAGAVSGFVFDEGGEPIIGVRVVALRRQFVAGEWRFVASGSELTDDRGEYRLFDLLPGDYVISVPSLKVTAPIASFEQVGQTGRVGGDLSALFNLMMSTSRNPLNPLDLNVIYDNDDKTMMLTPAAVPPPPDGKREFAYPTQYYPATQALPLAMAVLVTPGTDHRNVNFDLRPVRTFRVEGRVVGPDGPVQDQLLRLLPDDGDDFGLGTETALTVTAPDGSFTFLRVPAGRYTLDARSAANIESIVPLLLPPRPPVDAMEAPSRPPLWGRLALSIDESNVDDLIVTMQPGLTIRGWITFDGSAPRPTRDQLDNLSVSVVPADVHAPTLSARLDQLGQFSVLGLRPGEYFVRIDAAPAGWYVRGAVSGGRDVSERPLELSSATTPDVVITLTDRGTEVLGAVRDPRGMAAAGATVIVMPTAISERGMNPHRTRQVRAASSGVYFIEGLPPGEYYVVAVDDADAEGWQDRTRLPALRNTATRITLRENEKRTLELTIGPRR